MKTRTLLLIIIAGILLITNCKKDENSNCVSGNGDRVIDTRDVDPFEFVVVNGHYLVNFSQTPDTRLDLFGDSNILSMIETVSANNILSIQVANDQCYSTQEPIEATLTSPNYKSITLNGAGELEGHSINLDELTLEINGSAIINSSFLVKNFTTNINGSGDASLVGSAINANLNIAGEGNIYASILYADTCTIVISGSGDVRVHVNSFLNVTISGSGNVYYTGNPTLGEINITGSGQIFKEGS